MLMMIILVVVNIDGEYSDVDYDIVTGVVIVKMMGKMMTLEVKTLIMVIVAVKVTMVMIGSEEDDNDGNGGHGGEAIDEDDAFGRMLV